MGSAEPSTQVLAIAENGAKLAFASPTSKATGWPISRTRLLFTGVAGLAFLVRLIPVLRGGGLGFYGRYDDGVYYAAADALTFGRVPYRNFVLLHPPGILLVLTPFAFLGRLTSDPVGMAAARLAFMGIGALNAVLVAALARRWGDKAAVAAGVMYACWLAAVYGEQSTYLEPLGTTALLVALLLLLNTPRVVSPRAQMVAGAVLGLACAMKIWYVVPWAVVGIWQLASARPRAAFRVIASGVLALAVVLVPFLILARGVMFRMVVLDQFLRPQETTSRVRRVASILGVRDVLSHSEVIGATVLAAMLLMAAAVICVRDRSARVLVALLVANLTVLIVSPSYFGHYAELTAAPAALVVGVGLGRVATATRIRSAARAIYVASLLIFLVIGFRVATRPVGFAFPGAQFASAAPPGCVTSDDPQALIQMNRLSRDLADGCRVPVDVTGITYDTLHRRYPNGHTVRRGQNIAFQRYLYNYLLSGRSFVVARRQGDLMPRAVFDTLQRQPLLASGDGLTLRSGEQ